MPEKSSLTKFCESRGISDKLKTAFGAYLRSVYADKYHMKESGETIHFIINKMSEEDLSDAWQDYVRDLAAYLTQRPK